MLIHNTGLRDGFQAGSYVVDSDDSLPCKVQLLRSGKCSCSCSFFSHNTCHHCAAVAVRTGRVKQIVTSFLGRSLTRVSTSFAPKSFVAKAPPRKRPCREAKTPPKTVLDEERPPPIYGWSNWWYNSGNKDECQTQLPPTKCTHCHQKY